MAKNVKTTERNSELILRMGKIDYKAVDKNVIKMPERETEFYGRLGTTENIVVDDKSEEVSEEN